MHVTTRKSPAKTARSEAGIGFIETIIASSVLIIGLLGLAATFSEGMLHIATAQPDFMAKQKASEAIESVFAARDTRSLTWAQIRNASAGGIFLDGPQPIRAPGTDGLVNTADDGSEESIVIPGPDNILGSADDVRRSLTAFTREIEITDLAANLRQIRAVINYRIGRVTKRYVLVTFISSFA